MVRFVEVSDADFRRWEEESIADYALERVKAGNDDASSDRPREEFRSLLPQGKATRNNYIYSVVDEKDNDRKVGIIWYAVDSQQFPKDTLYIYDIVIEERFRGKGHGKAALLLLEDMARALEKRRISLHVFAHNERARRLYEELGYKPTNIVMSKAL
jgi:RimJ/RimL family protein N-acetyltransferase